MLNLLLISDSPNARAIKSTLQPVLRVIIDVVTDFDQGLKEVFEKRPATVCIQDQIGGVTGESVARHIQMLLGNDAPMFILLHSGNSKTKVISGLYEYLIDMEQSIESLAEDMQVTLKALLGEQWEKIYIPPPVTDVSSELIDVDKYEFGMVTETHPFDMPLCEEAKPEHIQAGFEQVVTADAFQPEAETEMDPVVLHVEPVINIREETLAPPPAADPPPSSAAGFRITQNVPDPLEEAVSEELHQLYEKNYRSKFRVLRQSVVAILFVLGVGGLFLLSQKPHLRTALKQQLFGTEVTQRPALKAAPAQVPIATPVPPRTDIPELPTFIPKDGLDSAYAAGHPGWERYRGDTAEFRVFRDSGRIMAVQVLATEAPLPEALISTVLKEIVGSPDYQITTRNTKAGVRIERGVVHTAGEIVVYRKDAVIKAFVVSRK